jgi:hypothetical protein
MSIAAPMIIIRKLCGLLLYTIYLELGSLLINLQSLGLGPPGEVKSREMLSSNKEKYYR